MNKCIFLIVICIGLYSCSKDEIWSVLPVARFETQKTYYDDGDTIHFFNTSENASSYSWRFGANNFSNEKNPKLVIDLKDVFIGYEFTAVLTAYNDDGLKNTYSKDFVISKRLLLDIHILRMDRSLEEKITQKGDQQLKMIVYMGPVNNPLEWITPEQSIPPSEFDLESGYPYKIYVVRTWPVIAMNNELWFMRFSVQPEGNRDDERIFLHEFRFNPCKAGYVLKGNNVRQFLVEDEKMAIAVDFLYR